MPVTFRGYEYEYNRKNRHKGIKKGKTLFFIYATLKYLFFGVKNNLMPV
jgi:hypothetical protein